MVDEWSGFAALLANLIEKYAVVLNLDALPNLVIEEAVSEKDEAVLLEGNCAGKRENGN